MPVGKKIARRIETIHEKVEEKIHEKKEAHEKKQFDKEHRLEKLLFVTVVVNDSQASSIGKMVMGSGPSLMVSMHGLGTASSDIYEVFGLGNQDKRVFFAPMKIDDYASLRKSLLERFAVSASAKGIAFAIDIDSFAGVASYRYCADMRYLKSKHSETKEGENTLMERNEDYVAVVAIVNDGYTDLVMEAAKGAGARGGTILTGHGTGNKEIEKYFGIAITPEKEMVLILVKREIKDAVMEAVYRDCGIGSKGQGIVFAIPLEDAIGLSGESVSQSEELESETPSDE